MLIDGLEWCGLLWWFYQLFGLSFWRHPFTAEHPLVSKWCNVTFLQIWCRNKLIYILGGPRAGPDLRTGILGTCLCSLVQGGPNTMKIFNIFFVILWAIYKSKRTKTPEDIEQINITNNRVKNDKLFPCFPLFYVQKSHFFLQFSLTDAHTRRRGQKLVIAAPRIYQ